MGVAGIAGDEHAWRPNPTLVIGDIVEGVRDPLADLVGRPPRDLGDLELVRGHDRPGLVDQHLLRHRTVGGTLVAPQLVELDVEPHHVSAFARNDQHAALGRGLDCTLQPNVGKVGHTQHVHHTPELTCGFAGQLLAEHAAHGASGSIATDGIPGSDGLGVVDRGQDRVVTIVVDPEPGQPGLVFDLEAGRRAAHRLEKEVVHPRLVEDHVGHLGQIVLDVLDAVGPVDGTCIVRAPERHFVDPVGLVRDPVSEAEGLEHLHRPAGDPVRLADLQRPGLLLDDPGGDIGETGELCSEGQPSGPASDDEHVDLVGPRPRPGGCLGHVRVTGAEAVVMELHTTILSGFAELALQIRDHLVARKHIGDRRTRLGAAPDRSEEVAVL